MRVGLLSIGIASVALTALLVVSAAVAAVLIASEIRAGGMKDKWVMHDVDSYGNEERISILYVNHEGDIIGEEGWNNPPCIVAISPEGKVLWRSPINAGPTPTQGPDDRYYYVDWATPDSGAWSNLTSLSLSGVFRWSYLVQNGTIDLWAIYADGIVIAHHFYYGLNATTQQWETITDRIFAISRDGTELWSMDMPFDDASWNNPGIRNDGTFVVHTNQSDGNYEFGIGKYGSPTYLQKGQYMTGYMDVSRSTYGGLYFELRKEGIDSQTTVISVYAFDMSSGTTIWRTILGYSDNPSNLTPGGGWQQAFPLSDGHGSIFCSDLDTGHTYCLDANGTIVWKKPDLGILVDVFPSGGLLAWDDSSIKRINSDGSVEWRHFAKHDGYSNILLASDETIYYNYGMDVHALVPSSGIGPTAMYLVIIAVIDVTAISGYVLVRMAKARKAADK